MQTICKLYANQVDAYIQVKEEWKEQAATA